MLISIIMPVYNEERYIGEIIGRVLKTDIEKELIIIDDFSTDGTREILNKFNRHEGVNIILHERNKGKGAAIRTGLRKVSGDVVIIQDADLEYDPRDYPKLLEPIQDGRADAVFGSRFLGGPHRVLFFWHYIGNKVLTLLSNILSNLNLTDMETGFKAFKADVIKGMGLKSDRFGFEPEVTARLARKRYRIYETPISYSGRSYAEGKKITWKDGLAAIIHIVRFNLLD
ncbi:MAG TPA: glycosyl transferase [Deltaproteobacteria bacterium]|nr:MAG: glycosyl transferase [Candidatus Gottesmanbacteria bacterium RIFCSPLOWO2_12_FULL_42_10]OGP23051.1 MAG: glycosyl transferase [Deltaproteobacteria bacterium GWB2_42_7]OGP41248.1 MAG: glycosyl transferase [Deltaproteobacteria bacterium GWD2_42_10]OGP47653.1 MAG: glycosyl transferase [Deltaproteobacteria bacterium GWF2_42_12]OGQ73952.1 MAG: glycosyl transferase [Deltaproteobacteria bacterium RIFOXYA2_FULL_42_10]HAG51628.1 glycosyl transferase [Deltaproteobacteria bacterium]